MSSSTYHMVLVDQRPCSSRGRQSNRWTRAECYEAARTLEIAIWDPRTRKPRRMDDICQDIQRREDLLRVVHILHLFGDAHTRQSNSEPRSQHDYGIRQYISLSQQTAQRLIDAHGTIGRLVSGLD